MTGHGIDLFEESCLGDVAMVRSGRGFERMDRHDRWTGDDWGSRRSFIISDFLYKIDGSGRS